MRTTIWERGSGPAPDDLSTGRYVLHFAGNPNACVLVHSAVKLCLGKRFPFARGHSLTPVKSDIVRLSNMTAYLMLEIDVEGFPWAMLLAALGVIGGGLFAFLSLTKVERIVDLTGPVGSTLMAAAVLGAVVLVGWFVFRKRRA
jgi:hypothetical protein